MAPVLFTKKNYTFAVVMNLATTYRYHDKGVSTFGGWNAFLFCWLVGLININIADIYIYIS